MTERRVPLRRAPPSLAWFMALAVVAAGCTSGDGGERSNASAKGIECPPEISVESLLELTCSLVTVPQDRGDSDGTKVRLFVIRIEPEAPATAAPIVYLGSAIGTSFDYRNLVDVAISLPRHELIAIELRGTGHSEPNLSCPEVDALAGRARARSITDPKMRRAFVNAVASCRARIASQGIDPAAFDVPAMAADVLDVVGTLHLSRWEMLSKGSTSRVVFEAMRADPPGLAGVVLYDPEFPDTDPLLQDLEGTRASLARLAEACRADRVCGSRFPDVEGDTQAAIDRLQRHPIVVRDDDQPVLMDGATLLRYLRARLASISDAQVSIGPLPATVAAIARRQDDVPVLTHLAQLDDSPQTYCSGFLPACSSNQTLNQGAYYSVLCRDEVPFSDVDARTELAHRDAAWVSDYLDNPYLDVCDAWGIPRADTSVTQPISSDIPILIESDAFSPFVTPAEVRRGSETLSRATIGISPVDGHHAGFEVTKPECFLERRLAFFDDPGPSADLGCSTEKVRLRFSTSPI